MVIPVEEPAAISAEVLDVVEPVGELGPRLASRNAGNMVRAVGRCPSRR
jgi:hypothetical protein